MLMWDITCLQIIISKNVLFSFSTHLIILIWGVTIMGYHYQLLSFGGVSNIIDDSLQDHINDSAHEPFRY